MIVWDDHKKSLFKVYGIKEGDDTLWLKVKDKSFQQHNIKLIYGSKRP